MSEEPRHDRFLRRRQLPDILHPSEGESVLTASRSKQSADGGNGCFFIGPFFGHPTKRLSNWDSTANQVLHSWGE